MSTLLQILMTNLGYIILTIIILIIIAIGAFVAIRLYMSSRRKYFIINFSEYMTVLNYHMEKAYDLIHKDRILVYSMEASRLEDVEFNRASQDFVTLLIKLLGPMLYKEFVFLFGDVDTFTFNLIEYFNTRYEDDEIRKASVENLTEEENT